jgi:outer membrane receptor protein involved in Fe transport
MLRSVLPYPCLAIFVSLTIGHAKAQQTNILPPVEVISNTPLPGMGQARNEIAAPVQSANSSDIDNSGALDLSDFMNRRLGSVHVNDMQGNPYQLDVSYRGYTASPLLGTPQGLSVYMDGVRMNQPFGDVVSWDLIPKSAISTMTLMPGSNPVFGLNTLGGALSIQTKNGKSDAGTSVQSSLGSYRRRTFELEHGGFNNNGLNWYVTANAFKEHGWRDESPSDVKQVFSKLGWNDKSTDLKLTLAHANNVLNGNGLQEQSLLASDWHSVYTKPDVTRNKSTLLNLTARHTFNDELLVTGNVYFRDIKSSSFNGDINTDALLRPADELLSQGIGNGIINKTQNSQKNYGVSSQLTWLGDVAGKLNHLVLGVAYDASRIQFGQLSQFGQINVDRSITAMDGLDHSQLSDARVDLSGRIQTLSIFASDTLSIQDNLHLTLSGRYNTSTINNRDQMHADEDASSLSGHHKFSRFNPAIGLTYNPTASLNAYMGYSESSRTPTAIELGCANPEQPCKLPNAMAGDPPLNQVVTRTVELGLRGSLTKELQWSAGVFRAENKDDILFVADDQSGFGYFKNFGKTRRQGVELGLSGKQGSFNFGANYTWLDATYQSKETVNGSGNSSNQSAIEGTPGIEGNIQISPGDRMPLIPRHMLKLSADFSATSALSINASMTAVAGVFARGNENNAHQADGAFYPGDGRTKGYAVFNLGAKYKATPRLQIMGQINNLFDTRYTTGAQLGANGFDANGNFAARPAGSASDAAYPVKRSSFYAPGAPRLFWLGLKYAF